MHTLEQLRSGTLTGISRLNLHQQLTEVPSEIFDLADTLEVLDLSGNRLTSLPAELPRLKRLKVLFCSNNPFEVLPEVLGACPALEMIGFKACNLSHVPSASLPQRLRWLTLTDNRIGALPDRFDHAPALQKLLLAGNRLSQLPESLVHCQRLELLRIACNQLSELPPWLLTLPRLAWLAYAGNPLSGAPLPALPSPSIDWCDLALQQKLGQGASGEVFQALLGAKDAVAVKCFNGMRTSDGSPEDEITACLAAGNHPNLIPVRGRLEGHPRGVHGLVMNLIGPAYQPLAAPPSLASCTRDIYASSTRFTLASAHTLLNGIAGAAAHLHRRGILHGDLYAHNIQHDARGHALLGDFGGASRYDRQDDERARAIEAIEVSAFGILLEEVIAHCDRPADHWHALGLACQQPDHKARPLFAEISALL